MAPPHRTSVVVTGKVSRHDNHDPHSIANDALAALQTLTITGFPISHFAAAVVPTRCALEVDPVPLLLPQLLRHRHPERGTETAGVPNLAAPATRGEPWSVCKRPHGTQGALRRRCSRELPCFACCARGTLRFNCKVTGVTRIASCLTLGCCMMSRGTRDALRLRSLGGEGTRCTRRARGGSRCAITTSRTRVARGGSLARVGSCWTVLARVS